MPRLYRWIVAVLLMLCLPLQGMAAVAMPMGMGHDVAPVASHHIMQADAKDHHCMQHKQDEAQADSSAAPCDNCFTCHISVSQALMPVTAKIHAVPGAMPAGLFIGDEIALLTFPVFRPPISA
jgi:hypothetical protein